jgi:hypothetical protein
MKGSDLRRVEEVKKWSEKRTEGSRLNPPDHFGQIADF